MTDEYGNDVQRLARPLPVEYLLVDVPASTPLNPQFTFLANQSEPNKDPFPIENRFVEFIKVTCDNYLCVSADWLIIKSKTFRHWPGITSNSIC